jgi:uncharacterized coiled-coil protein SlyX
MESRLTQIEEKLLFLERQVESLDEVVLQTSRQVAVIQQQIDRLRSTMRDLQDRATLGAPDDDTESDSDQASV